MFAKFRVYVYLWCDGDTAIFYIGKLSKITLVTATHDSQHCACIGHLGWPDLYRNDPVCVMPPKAAMASTNGSCHMSLSPIVLLTSVINVNDP